MDRRVDCPLRDEHRESGDTESAMRANQKYEAEDADNRERRPDAEAVIPREKCFPDPVMLERTPSVKRMLRMAWQDIEQRQRIAIQHDADDHLRKCTGDASAEDRQPLSHGGKA